MPYTVLVLLWYFLSRGFRALHCLSLPHSVWHKAKNMQNIFCFAIESAYSQEYTIFCYFISAISVKVVLLDAIYRLYATQRLSQYSYSVLFSLLSFDEKWKKKGERIEWEKKKTNCFQSYYFHPNNEIYRGNGCNAQKVWFWFWRYEGAP